MTPRKYRDAIQPLYRSKEWRAKRELQLTLEPLCRLCKQVGRITAATVADHIEPHRGDLEKFWDGELMSLCATCHSSVKQEAENRGYVRGCDASGWPLDPAHPVNRGR